MKASDIKFENGKIRLQAGKETIAETPIVQMDVNAEIVTDDTVKMDENGQTKLFQSMYKDTTSKNIANFVDNANNNKNEYKKAKFQIKDLKLSLPADIVRHDLNDHNLTAGNWQELEENIENIYIANKANGTSSYGNNLYVFGVKTQNDNYYYLCVAINNKDNYIVTATKDHKNTVESYVTGKNKTPSKVPNALPPVAPFSKESSDNIITYLKDNFNPNTLYQTAEPVNSEAFKKWFGDSKVVDENGQPLVVYHGTPNGGFDIFDKSKIKKGNGFWFTDDKQYAKQFGKNIISSYIKMENPFNLDLEENNIEKYSNNPEDLINNSVVQDKLMQDGYDGIIFEKNDKTKTYIVFNSNQIKSVDNQGTFDEENPNIYMQLKNLPKQEKVHNGAFTVSEKAIELFKTADFSTLPHEFAHFWLDNMWEFSRSGRASEAYMNNFNSVLDWLGVKESILFYLLLHHIHLV